MSASLVGSEMCIRDRKFVALHLAIPTPRNTINDICSSEHQSDNTHIKGSVSYTHLTLPTICSV
eukprot:8284990-Alexandrium_andersonii.AAC.1